MPLEILRSSPPAVTAIAGALLVLACSSGPNQVHAADGVAGTSGSAAAMGTAASGAAAGTTNHSTGGTTSTSTVTAPAGTAGTSSSACTSFGTPVAVGEAQPTVLTNLSGLVASRSQPGVLFAHPDRSGAIFFALQQTGVSLGQFTLTGITATDCEDIAIGPGPDSANTLYLGDIGDNTSRSGTVTGRSEIQVYRVAEPLVPATPSSTVTSLTNAQILHFKYPDRTHDAETLMVDPNNGDLFIVTREADGSAFVFVAPGSGAADSTTTLTQLALIQVGASGANAGDIAPTGDRALIRTYKAAWLYLRSPGATWQQAFAGAAISLPAADETQSEGATFSADGRSWLSCGEVTPIIYRADASCP